MVKIYCQTPSNFRLKIVPVLITWTFLITLTIFKKRLHFWFLRSTAPIGLFISFIYISIAIDKLQTALDYNYINQCTGCNLHKLYKLIYYSCSLYNKLFLSVARIRFQHLKLLCLFTDPLPTRILFMKFSYFVIPYDWLLGFATIWTSPGSDLNFYFNFKFTALSAVQLDFAVSIDLNGFLTGSFVCSVLLPLYRFRSWSFSCSLRTEQISSSFVLRGLYKV